MKCEEAREHLSAFLDDMLEQALRVRLENHLSKCEKCNLELSELRNVIGSISSLDQIKAPSDFLDNLNKRLEPSFNLRKFFKTIFFPLQIKIPMQAAAIALSILLVFAVVQQLQRSTDEFPRPMAPKPMEETMGSEKETLPENAKPAKDRPKLQEPPKLKETFYKKEPAGKADLNKSTAEPQRPIIDSDMVKKTEEMRKPKPVELVVFIEPAKPTLTEGSAMKKLESDEETVAGGRAEKKGASLAGHRALKESEIKERSLADQSRGQETPPRGDVSEVATGGILAKIQRLVFASGGKVITTVQSYQATTPSLIKTEIPAGSYKEFCNKIKMLSPQVICPTLDSITDQAMITINIKIFQK